MNKLKGSKTSNIEAMLDELEEARERTTNQYIGNVVRCDSKFLIVKGINRMGQLIGTGVYLGDGIYIDDNDFILKRSCIEIIDKDEFNQYVNKEIDEIKTRVFIN